MARTKEQQAIYMRLWRAKRKAEGRPVLCTTPRKPRDRAVLAEYRRKSKMLRRARCRLNRICWDCGALNTNKLRCSACARKAASVPHDRFARIRTALQELQAPINMDRRRGGEAGAALSWALTEHRLRHEPEDDGMPDAVSRSQESMSD